MKRILIILSFVFALTANAQTGDTLDNGLTIDNFYLFGGLEMYYTYDFNDPASQNRPGFEYSHTRHNQISLNTGIFGFAFEDERLRSKFGLVFGDYSMSNYAAEPTGLQNILEANIGIKVSKDLWFDVGVFGSHIGAEAAFGPDNPTLTRSIVANSSPYFESGAKLTYAPSKKWKFAALALNGWQNIQENNTNKALGTQIMFTPNKNLLFNYSTFYGEGYNDPANNTRRFFNNFYTVINVNDSTDITLQTDFGVEEGNPWYGFTLIGRQWIIPNLAWVGRVEYFVDPNEIVYVTGTPSGFEVGAISIGVDYRIYHGVVWRNEIKALFSPDEIFEEGSGVSNRDVMFTTSLSFKFN